MNESDKDCVLLFVKYPEKGEVKKRLASRLGDDITVELYRCFVRDSLSTIETCGGKLLICVYPPESQKGFAEWLGVDRVYVPQLGTDLGQRMKTSFVDAFNRGFQFVVAVGSDIPDLPAAFMKEAYLSLRTHDAVIGPSIDGGYYLIGFNKRAFLPETFDGIDWGTHTVFQDTLAVLRSARCNLYTLPKWRDMDTIADLRHLMDGNRDTEFRNSKTLSYLETIAELLT